MQGGEIYFPVPHIFYGVSKKFFASIRYAVCLLTPRYSIAAVGMKCEFSGFSSVLSWSYGMTKQRLLFQFAALLLACGLSAAVMARPWPIATAGGLATYSISDCAECPKMVVVPAGSFVLDESGSQRKITISQAFAAGKFEVTFDEWEACVAAGGCGNYLPSDEGWGRGQRPVMNVSWDDAQLYLQWLSRKTGNSYRLLSEAEWEYAARAGITPQNPRGKAAGSISANCLECDSQWSNTQIAPVGSLKPNAFGLYDMHGNVWEWVEGCVGCNCDTHIMRGAALGSGTGEARSARRLRGSSSDRNGNVGFRVAMHQNIGSNAAKVQQASVIDVCGLIECVKPVIAEPPPLKKAKEIFKTVFSDKIITIEGTNFDTDSAKLKPDADIKLNEVVTFANQNQEANLVVTGHTDSTGSDAWNMKLSAARAESVKTYLVGKGVAVDRITTKGEGAARPVGDNQTIDGRAQNRRVEISSVIREQHNVRVTE